MGHPEAHRLDSIISGRRLCILPTSKMVSKVFDTVILQETLSFGWYK